MKVVKYLWDGQIFGSESGMVIYLAVGWSIIWQSKWVSQIFSSGDGQIFTSESGMVKYLVV